MPQQIIRERVFDAICFLAGKASKIVDFNLNRPVFVIGTGRCGTTLLVDLLNSHSSLSGFPGEANELWHPMLEPYDTARIDIQPIEIDPSRFSEVSVANWPNHQKENLRTIFTGFNLLTGLSKTFFTKSAMISFLIPEILDIFPDARFIHIYRFGPSVIESYFKKNFGKYKNYQYSEREYKIHCAKYWNACIMEIEKRKEEFSLIRKGQFLELSYEDLCQNPKDALLKLAEFLKVSVEGFKFDIHAISSQNYKAAESKNGLFGGELLRVMDPAMKLKGYLSI
jgi:hypothetical protein